MRDFNSLLACRLSSHVLAFACPTKSTTIRVNDSPEFVPTRIFSPQESGLSILIARSESFEHDLLSTISLATDSATHQLSGEDLCDLKTFLRETCSPLAAKIRQDIVGFFASLLKEGCPDSFGLSASLVEINESLRERLPIARVSEQLPQSLHVDSLFRVTDTAFYMRGWFRDEHSAVTQLTAVSPEGARVEILADSFRYHRTDVHTFYRRPAAQTANDKFGFIRYFEIPTPSLAPDGWVVEMRSASGFACEAAVPPVDAGEVRDAILSDISLKPPGRDSEILRQVHLAISRLQEDRHKSVRAKEVVQYGAPPVDPPVSIIVPLYGRVDFLEQQLAQFVRDPEFTAVDLIYVLDSPELAEHVNNLAARLTELYGISFRIASLNCNGGFSAANNIGASLARSDVLLLLNSDVLPSEPGWLGNLLRYHKANPKLGALGVKLLFEDGSLQHAGMYFSRMLDGSGWENMHYFKGLDGSLPAANEIRTVPAVTAACLMIDRALYESVGGLRGAYVQGDYEDSDLCLRLAAQGRESCYFPGVTLYHLEGQSYPAPLRALTSRYNRWLHSQIWEQQMTDAMTCYGTY